jgi:RNA polymerase sigma factor (TIGR02999 family)
MIGRGDTLSAVKAQNLARKRSHCVRPMDNSGMSAMPSSAERDSWNEMVYARLRSAAKRLFRNERRRGLLQPTALIHEAYLRVVRHGGSVGRTRFFAAAVGEMRRALVDHARWNAAEKRGGHAHRLTMDTCALALPRPTIDLAGLYEALARLAKFSPRQARVVELRFLAGLNEDETAAALDVSRRTVQQDWRGAKAWLRRELSEPVAAPVIVGTVSAASSPIAEAMPSNDT